MKTVTVGFSKHRGKAVGSQLIRWYMDRDFSHTFFKFKECRFKDHTIYHAVGKGLIYVSETTFLEHNEIVAEFNINISDELFDELLQDCHHYAGRDYGFLQNLGILLVRSLNKIGLKINKNPIDDGINCSEWMYYLLEEIYGKWTTTEPNLVAPDEVFDFLMKEKEKGTLCQ